MAAKKLTRSSLASSFLPAESDHQKRKVGLKMTWGISCPLKKAKVRTLSGHGRLFTRTKVESGSLRAKVIKHSC